MITANQGRTKYRRFRQVSKSTCGRACLRLEILLFEVFVDLSLLSYKLGAGSLDSRLNLG